MVLQTEKVDNVDVIFSQIKTILKKIVIWLIYNPPIHDIITDSKWYDQIIEISNSFERIIFVKFNLLVNSLGNHQKSHMGHDLYNN